MSIKKGVDYDGMAWDGDSYVHQMYVFPSHVTEPLLSLSPISESVNI